MDNRIPTIECIKVAFLRKKYGPNMDALQWINNINNVYVGDQQHIKVNGVVTEFERSQWYNPFGKEYTSEESMDEYENRVRKFFKKEVLLKELAGKNLGCFCEAASNGNNNDDKLNCHAKILVKVFKEYSSSLYLSSEDALKLIHEGNDIFRVMEWTKEDSFFPFFALSKYLKFEVTKEQFKERLYQFGRTASKNEDNEKNENNSKVLNETIFDYLQGLNYGIFGRVLYYCLNTKIDLDTLSHIPLQISLFDYKTKDIFVDRLQKARKFKVLKSKYDEHYYIFPLGEKRHIIINILIDDPYLYACEYGNNVVYINNDQVYNKPVCNEPVCNELFCNKHLISLLKSPNDLLSVEYCGVNGHQKYYIWDGVTDDERFIFLCYAVIGIDLV